MSCGDENGNAFGGHLNRAIVYATCEIFIDIINGEVDRSFNENIGLDLFEFN